MVRKTSLCDPAPLNYESKLSSQNITLLSLLQNVYLDTGCIEPTYTNCFCLIFLGSLNL